MPISNQNSRTNKIKMLQDLQKGRPFNIHSNNELPLPVLCYCKNGFYQREGSTIWLSQGDFNQYQRSRREPVIIVHMSGPSLAASEDAINENLDFTNYSNVNPNYAE